MTHTIENSNGQLMALMKKVQEQNSRSFDFTAPTKSFTNTNFKSGRKPRR